VHTLDVATIVPVTDPVLTLIVKVSGPSVVRSDASVTVKDPALLVMVNDPDGEEKSALEVLMLLTAQYRVVPLAMPTVLILNKPLLPSSVDCAIEYTNVGVSDVSISVTDVDVATIGPVVDPVLILTVKV